jgi:RimJ/RimL family protein N-acetyltransferase
MTPADAPGLYAALDDSRVYASGFGGGPAGRPGSVDEMARWVQDSIDDDRRAAVYTVRLVGDGLLGFTGSLGATGSAGSLGTAGSLGATGTIIGTSSLGDLSLPNERIHLGWTAYSPAVWASPVNPECKLLLLGHAFDDCGLGRVKIQTDNLNTRSQGAIARLGAVREGVLRRHQHRADGTFRDTVVFSILRDEWPAVRDGLLARLAAGRAG